MRCENGPVRRFLLYMSKSVNATWKHYSRMGEFVNWSKVVPRPPLEFCPGQVAASFGTSDKSALIRRGFAVMLSAIKKRKTADIMPSNLPSLSLLHNRHYVNSPTSSFNVHHLFSCARFCACHEPTALPTLHPKSLSA